MLTHSKKINAFVLIATALLICSHDLLAQQPSSAPTPDQVVPQTPSASPGVAQAPGQAPPQAASGNGDSSTASALDYLFNHKPQQGTVAKEGMEANQQAKTDALAQDALGNQQIEDPDVRAQFETYLAMNEVPQNQLKSYADDMQNVIDLLHQKRTTEAWQQL